MRLLVNAMTEQFVLIIAYHAGGSFNHVCEHIAQTGVFVECCERLATRTESTTVGAYTRERDD